MGFARTALEILLSIHLLSSNVWIVNQAPISAKLIIIAIPSIRVIRSIASVVNMKTPTDIAYVLHQLPNGMETHASFAFPPTSSILLPCNAWTAHQVPITTVTLAWQPIAPNPTPSTQASSSAFALGTVPSRSMAHATHVTQVPSIITIPCYVWPAHRIRPLAPISLHADATLLLRGSRSLQVFANALTTFPSLSMVNVSHAMATIMPPQKSATTALWVQTWSKTPLQACANVLPTSPSTLEAHVDIVLAPFTTSISEVRAANFVPTEWLLPSTTIPVCAHSTKSTSITSACVRAASHSWATMAALSVSCPTTSMPPLGSARAARKATSSSPCSASASKWSVGLISTSIPTAKPVSVTMHRCVIY